MKITSFSLRRNVREDQLKVSLRQKFLSLFLILPSFSSFTFIYLCHFNTFFKNTNSFRDILLTQKKERKKNRNYGRRIFSFLFEISVYKCVFLPRVSLVLQLWINHIWNSITTLIKMSRKHFYFRLAIFQAFNLNIVPSFATTLFKLYIKHWIIVLVAVVKYSETTCAEYRLRSSIIGQTPLIK